MQMYQLLTYVPLLALLLLAAAQDVRTRRIPNWLTLTVILAGLIQSFTSLGVLSPAQAGLGLLAGLGLPFILFGLGALGGGDVKLFAGIGTWVGPWLVVQSFALAAIVGLVVVLIQAAWSGKLSQLFRNSALVLINLIHVREMGIEHVSQTGHAAHSIDKPMPYAVPILLGTIGSLALQLAGRSLV